MCFTKRCHRLKNTARASWFVRWICCCAAISDWSRADLTNRSYCSRHWCRLSQRSQSRLKNLFGTMSTSSANLSVLVGKNFACVKIVGRANFTSSPDFKTLFGELAQKGYTRFIIDLEGCVLMDSTFLGVLAGFGLKMNQKGVPG